MRQVQVITGRRGESGNVLFLILIAVALFAALSYAVTQSTRSGGGDASGETNLINSAQLTQYPASVRTAIVRMIINGTGVEELEFNSPSNFSACTGTGEDCVFHPSGGGATYVNAPADVMATAGQGTWHYNGEFEMVNIGTSVASDEAGNEIMAFLPGISQAVCNQVNDRNSLANRPVITANISAEYTTDMDDTYTMPSDETVLGTGGEAGTNIADFDGHPFGCFENPAGTFVYYHVLVER
jgi:hypothetical protein